jgi:plasmid stabilization system protein ParE
LVDPASLKPNPANPNRHSAHQIQLLASIIQEQGWRNPVTVSNRSGLIVRGHGRLEAAILIGCETIPVDEQDYASDAEELADLLADNRLSELAELDEDDLRRVLKSIADADPDFDIELTGFMEDEIRKLMDDAGSPEDELETIPRMECQAFETHDYLAFMFHDLRDWMQVLQLMGVREVDYSITRRTKKIGIGRVLHGKRLIDLCTRAAMAGTSPAPNSSGDSLPQSEPVDHEPQALSDRHAPRSNKRG